MAGMGGRMSTVIKAKINKLLDKAEDPGETLEYSYQRQMELLQNVKKGIADVVTSKKRLQLQQTKLEQQVVKLDTQARQALSAGKEDLARTALERKQFAQGELQSLDQQVAELEQQQQTLIQKEQQLRTKIDQFRTKKEVIKAQYSAAEASVKISEAATGVGEEMADVGLAMQRAVDKTENMRARAGAMEELEAAGAFDDNLALGSGQDDIDRQLHELTSQTEVDDDLAKMKAELGQGSRRRGAGARAGQGGPGVIVRIATEGQYRFPDDQADRLNDLDNGVVEAVDAGDEDVFHERFEELLALVRARGHAARRRRARGLRRHPPAARHLVRRGVGGVHRRRADPRLDRDVPEREPALELRLDGQVGADLGLQAQLALGVALLLAARRDERVERAALVVVDPVDRLGLLVAEREHGGQQRGRRSRRACELGGDRVDADHEVLEVGVAEDHPAVAELVVLLGRSSSRSRRRCSSRAPPCRRRSASKSAVAERLEDDRRLGRALEPHLGLERDAGGAHREQPVGRGALDLALAGENVEEAHGLPGYARPWSCASSRCSAAIRFSIGGCVANRPEIEPFTPGGKM